MCKELFTLEPNQSRKKFSCVYVIVGLCFLMVFTCLGFCSSNRSLYLPAITEAMDIKRSAFSLSDSCRFITTAIVNIFFGSLVAKFGEKKLIAAGFFCLIAFAPNLLVFYIGGVFLGIFSSLALPLETIMLPIFAGDIFSEKSFNKIMGPFVSVNTAGYAVGTPTVNLVFDLFGSYVPVLFLGAFIMIVITIVFQFILTSADRTRRAVTEQ